MTALRCSRVCGWRPSAVFRQGLLGLNARWIYSQKQEPARGHPPGVVVSKKKYPKIDFSAVGPVFDKNEGRMLPRFFFGLTADVQLAEPDRKGPIRFSHRPIFSCQF